MAKKLRFEKKGIKRGSLFLKVVLFIVIFCGAKDVAAEEGDRYFELGIGIGTNIFQDIDTTQLLIAPALNWKIKNMESLRFRVEGDIELINDDSRWTFLVGVAPLLRMFIFDSKLRPFLEGGAGVNLISRHSVKDRELGGSIIFSPMAGVGIEITNKEMPISISYRYRHLSNAGLYDNNKGIDSHYLMFSVGF